MTNLLNKLLVLAQIVLFITKNNLIADFDETRTMYYSIKSIHREKCWKRTLKIVKV